MLRKIINYLVTFFKKFSTKIPEKSIRVSKRLYRRSWKRDEELSIFAISLFISTKPKERILLTSTRNESYYSIYANLKTLSLDEKLTIIAELVKEINPKQKIILYSLNDLSTFLKGGFKQTGITTAGYPILIKAK